MDACWIMHTARERKCLCAIRAWLSGWKRCEASWEADGREILKKEKPAAQIHYTSSFTLRFVFLWRAKHESGHLVKAAVQKGALIPKTIRTSWKFHSMTPWNKNECKSCFLNHLIITRVWFSKLQNKDSATFTLVGIVLFGLQWHKSSRFTEPQMKPHALTCGTFAQLLSASPYVPECAAFLFFFLFFFSMRTA